MTFTLVETMDSEEPSERATEYMVPTRDGFTLATDVYLPEGVTSASAILVRTPYDKSSRYTALKMEAEYYLSRGFVVITQDVRGKFRSTGPTVPYAYDVADAYDTAEWVVAQPWSNGRIGVTGASYYGFTTWAAAVCGHPAIRAAVPMVTGLDMGNGHVGANWWHEVPSFGSFNDLVQIWTDNRGYLADIDWQAGPTAEVVAEARKHLGQCIAAEQKLERAVTGDWYNPYGSRHPYYTTSIPVLHWQNWYDPGLAPAGMRDWRHFRRQGGARDLHFLRVGSADHSGYLLEDVGAGDARNPYLDDATMQQKITVECGEVADFFDEFLNDDPPAQPRPRARFHAGHVGWQTGPEYPPPSTELTFHLTAAQDGVHSLGRDPSSQTATLGWLHDPDNPVPSTVDIEAIWYYLAAYPDERDQLERSDVLTFTSAPLAADLDFAGQPVLQAHIAFDATSTHVHARLQDVHPDGTTRPISWGRTVLHELAGSQLRLQMDDNAYRIKAGHRLQLQLQSSDFPHYAIHPGTDECPWTATELRSVQHTLTVGGAPGATLTLPTVSFA